MKKNIAELALIVTLAGCQNLGPTNPYDPNTPTSQQTKAALSGAVHAPGLPNAAGLVIKLRHNANVIYQTQTITGQVEEQGLYSFNDLEPGIYRLTADQADNPQFADYNHPYDITLAPGDALAEINLELQPLTLSELGMLTGRVWLAGEVGKPRPDHQGIRVSVQTLTNTTDTNTDGSFTLMLPPNPVGQPYGIVLSYRDYQSLTVAVSIRAGETGTLSEQPIVLAPNPATITSGQLSGRVYEEQADGNFGLSSGALATLQGTSITGLVDGGSFRLTNVPAGAYILSISKDDFESVHQLILVSGGEILAISQPLYLTLLRGTLQGTVRLQDGQNPADTVAEIGNGYFSAADNTGHYMFRRVPIGPYNLALSKEGYVGLLVPMVEVEKNVITTVPEKTLQVQVGTFYIEEGPYTGSTDIHLIINTTDKSDLCATEDPMIFSDAQTHADALSDCFSRYNIAPSVPFTLSSNNGLKRVYVQYLDTHNVPSATFFATTKYDDQPPELGFVYINGIKWEPGKPSIMVEDSVVNVEVFPVDTDSAYFAISESTADLGTCHAPYCQPISAARVFALSVSIGEKRLYYRFFDYAKNASLFGEYHINLVAPQVVRPLPKLTAVIPASIVALSSTVYKITAVGKYFATDTQMRIGDFELAATCDGLSDIITDLPGIGCRDANITGDSCTDNTCRNCCQALLTPASPAWSLVKLAGSYLVRAVTPSPVLGTGVSLSSDFLNVVAPMPTLTDFTVVEPAIAGHGERCFYGEMDRCALPERNIRYLVRDYDGIAAGDKLVVLWGNNFMDNVAVQLDTMFAEIGAVLPPDPSRTILNDYYVAIARFSEVNLPAQEEPYRFALYNPSPGGGEATTGFGINWAWRYKRSYDTYISSFIGKTNINSSMPGYWEQRYENPYDDLYIAARILYTDVSFIYDMADPKAYMTWFSGEDMSEWTVTKDPLIIKPYYRTKGGSAWLGAPLGLTNYRQEISAPRGPIHAKLKLDDKRRLPTSLGTFSAYRIIPTVSRAQPNSLTIADLDGDGNNDLAIFNQWSSDVGILLGNSLGTYSATQRYPVHAESKDMAIADLNGDNILDIVTTSEGSHKSSILFGRGDGTFQEELRLMAGGTFVTTGDFNDDDKIDLLLIYDTGGLCLLYGADTGTFSKACDAWISLPFSDHLFGPISYSLADFNDDGRQDIAMIGGSGWGAYLGIYFGTGEGVTPFVRSQNVTLSATAYSKHYLAAGDLNFDGAADLIITNQNNQSVSVFLNDGAGQVQNMSTIIQATGGWGKPGHVALYDINGNGTLDMIMVDEDFSGGKGAIFTALGGGDGTFWNYSNYLSGLNIDPRYVTVADLNGDHVPDIAVVNPDDDSAVLLLAETEKPTINFAANLPNVVTGTDTVNSMATADFNGDGKDELMVGLSNGTIRYYKQAADGSSFLKPTSLAASGNCIGMVTGYFDSTGGIDLAAISSNDATINVFLGNGDGTFKPRKDTAGSLASATSLVTGYFSTIGNLDLAITDYGVNKVKIYSGKGDGTFNAPSVISTGTGPVAVASASFTNDYRSDLAVANSTSQNITILLNQGNGSFLEPTASPLSMAWGYYGSISPVWVAAGDMDGDHKQDVAVTTALGFIRVFWGNGDGSFDIPGSEKYLNFYNMPRALMNDFNNDGIMDFAVTNSNINTLEVMLGNTSKTISDAAAYKLEGKTPTVMAIGDFNGDYADDAAVAFSATNNVALQIAPVYPRGLRQELMEMSLANSTVPINSSDFYIHQASQAIWYWGLSLVIEFSEQPSFGSVQTSLTAPNGTGLALGDHVFSSLIPWPPAPAQARAWRLVAHYPTTTILGNKWAITGYQTGGDWKLTINNTAGKTGKLISYTLTTWGKTY